MKPAMESTAAAFVAGTLSRAEWTHWAHLRVGLWHVLRHGEAEALDLLRARIRAINDRHGVPNTDAGGYHETLTRFYVHAIAAFVAACDEGLGPDELSERLVLALGDRDLPLRHWSRERLMSVEARRGWVEPDLAPLGSPVPAGGTSPGAVLSAGCPGPARPTAARLARA